MGAKGTHVFVPFRFGFVCLCPSRRGIQGEKPRLQSAVRPGGVCKLLQSFYLKVWFDSCFLFFLMPALFVQNQLTSICFQVTTDPYLILTLSSSWYFSIFFLAFLPPIELPRVLNLSEKTLHQVASRFTLWAYKVYTFILTFLVIFKRINLYYTLNVVHSRNDSLPS